MKVEDAEEYTESLGQIVAGSWRQIAWADRQGIPEALGLTTREWVDERLGGYVRLSIPERREAVAELTEEGMTQREVADVLGVSAATVNGDVVQDQTPEPGQTPEPPPTATDVVQDQTPDEPTPEQVAQRLHDDEVARCRARLEHLATGLIAARALVANDPTTVEAFDQLTEADRKQITEWINR